MSGSQTINLKATLQPACSRGHRSSLNANGLAGTHISSFDCCVQPSDDEQRVSLCVILAAVRYQHLVQMILTIKIMK